jgi:integrase
MSLQTKSQVRIKSSHLLLTGDEPMLRRLKPPYKIDKVTGKVLPDYIDEDGIGHLKNRKWFSHIKYKGKTIDVSLDANEREIQKAVMNLGLLVQDLQLGKTPNGTRKKIRLLKPEKTFIGDFVGIRKNYIDPFFGEYTPNELTLGLMEEYLEFRWGKDKDGNLQAKERTLKGEMMVLRQLVESADGNFKFHKRLLADLKYVSLFKDLLPPLTRAQIDLAWEQAKITRGGDDYKRSFWIMVWTGMEAMDICTLCPKHFVNIKGQEWLIKDRHKTILQKQKTVIKLPVLPEFKQILSEVPTPIDKNTPYFPKMDNKSCNKAIQKYFKRVKQEVDGVTTYPLEGYGSKYLRRHLGELALDMGKSESWVQQALGHAFDSQITRKYMRVREDSMMDVFEAIGGNG